MILRDTTRIAALVLLVLASVSTNADTNAVSAQTNHLASLKQGDPAPKLYVSKWVQGEPVTEFKAGTAYIVEFWATWCGPCKEAIPHLNKLHQKYKDRGLIIIGQDIKEETPAKVATFVKRMGNQMTYRVATEQPSTDTNYSGLMHKNWYKAAGQQGIPCAFLIDKHGKIVWITDPRIIEEEDVEELLADKFDTRKKDEWLADQIAKNDEWNGHRLAARDAVKSKQWNKAMSEIDEMEKINGKDKTVFNQFRLTVLMAQEDFETASKLATRVCQEDLDDAGLQNRIAWQIAKRGLTNSVILKAAQTAAERAVSISKRNDPDYLETLARIAFLQGKKEQAIATEKDALKASDEEDKSTLHKKLDSYQAGKLPESD